MERNITSEANVEQDLYYTGIAEKAFVIVQKFLAKNKNKLEGEGDDSVIHKPFIALNQYKGVAVKGSDIDKNFPGLSDLLFGFIPVQDKGGYKIKGGVDLKPIKVGGVMHKGVLVTANLIGTYNGQHMDTRFSGNKSAFIHEYIHYLDHLRYRSKGITKSMARYLDAGDYEAYYNTPEEYNAFYQEGQSQLIRVWKGVPEDLKKKKLKSYRDFQAWVIFQMEFFDKDFIAHINDKYLKKFKKRLANLYMYIQKGKLSEVICESKITIDSNSIKKWAGDLRKLTKAYKSIGDSENDPDTLKQYDKVRKAYIIFANNFEKWVYKFFLQYNWQGSRQSTETWEAKEVREKAWTAFASLNGNFPEAWDYVEKVHKPSPQLLVRYREKTIRRYQAAFREGIKAMLDYIGIHGDQERLKPIEQVQVGPVKLVIHNHARQGGSEQGQLGREKSLRHLTTNIKKWASIIKKAGFGKCIDNLTVDLEFSLTGESGELVNGEYYMNKDMLKLYGVGMTQNTFTHELGHRFWYREVPSNAKKHWTDTLKSKEISIERKHVEDFVKKYFDEQGNKVYKRRVGLKVIDKKETNFETKAIYKTLQMTSVWSANSKAEVVTKLADEYVGPGKEIPIEHITNYGKTNAEEAFAEAFKLYIIKGPGKLGEWTRWFFKEIVRTGGASINEMKIQEGKETVKFGLEDNDGWMSPKKSGFEKILFLSFIGNSRTMDKWRIFHTVENGKIVPNKLGKELNLAPMSGNQGTHGMAFYYDKKKLPKIISILKKAGYPIDNKIKEHKMINEVTLTKETIKEFVKFASDALELKNKVSLKLLNKRTDEMTAACYNPQTNEISIYIKERAYADVCRSIAHELVHQKQNELGILEADSGQTGSDIENEANSCAGIIMRNYGDVVENLYN
jgi:hypothetical protein